MALWDEADDPEGRDGMRAALAAAYPVIVGDIRGEIWAEAVIESDKETRADQTRRIVEALRAATYTQVAAGRFTVAADFIEREFGHSNQLEASNGNP